MTDTATSTDQGTSGQEPQSAPQATTVDQLPEWARKAITDANGEAAKYRNEKKSAVEAAKAEVVNEYEQKVGGFQTQLEELKGEVSARELELVKLRTAIDAGVPNEAIAKFASLLQGSTEDEVKSHAEEVKDLFKLKPPADRPVDHSQGSGGSSLPLNGDPLLNALKRAVGAS